MSLRTCCALRLKFLEERWRTICPRGFRANWRVRSPPQGDCKKHSLLTGAIALLFLLRLFCWRFQNSRNDLPCGKYSALGELSLALILSSPFETFPLYFLYINSPLKFLLDTTTLASYNLPRRYAHNASAFSNCTLIRHTDSCIPLVPETTELVDG